MQFQEVPTGAIHKEQCTVEKNLLSSLRAEGVLVPVVLERNGSGYVVIDGRRRVTAAALLGMEKVPAVIIDSSEKGPELLGVTLNLHRSPNMAFEVRALRSLIRAGYTQEEIAETLHTTKTRLKRHFRLLALCDEGLKALEEGRLRVSTALVLARLPEDRQKAALAMSDGEKIALRGVESSWKEFRLKEAALLPACALHADRPEVDGGGEAADSGKLQALDGLALEFESLVSRMTSSRPMPPDVQKAVEVLRKYLNRA